jgi:hypothetical protein
MRIRVLVIIFMMSFCGVSYAGLFDFNPQAKLNEADYMLHINRPIAADKLIDDVIRFCQKKDDEPCLALSYYLYGKVLSGDILSESERQKYGNRKILGYTDKEVTYGNVDQKSLAYFEKALALAKKHGMNDVVSGIYIKIGILQFTSFKDRDTACDSFDRSLEYHQQFQKDNPGANVILEKGFKSFEEYIAQGKSEMGCQK